MEADFPRDPADISLHWLSRIVGLSRAVNGGENANLQLLPIGDDQGASARVLRAEITWRGNSDLPKSVVLKFASAKAEYREYARTMGTYLKEVRFYQHFGADASLPIPKVHFADIDEATGEFLIVMEDLGGARMADWFADGADDVRAALTALAGIHAKFWGDESLSALAWLPCSDDEQQGGQYETMLRQLLPTAKAKFAGLLSEYSWSVLDAWADNFELVRRSAASAPKTLVHREADMRQMFFPTANFERFVLFDWQSPERGSGAIDVGRMIATSLSVAQRRRHEDALVEWYVAELRACGVNDVSAATLWPQIKLSLLMNVLAHMFSLLWVESEETKVWRHEHLGVLGRGMEDWQLLEVIEGLKRS